MSSDVLVGDSQTVVLQGRRPRIASLDMTKGVLVVAMVVYHSFNYSLDYRLGFKYLPFLPPSFILITGFLIARLYFNPVAARDPKCHLKLLLRGLRLLAIFTLLNVGTNMAGGVKWGGEPRGVGYIFEYWPEIFGIGGGQFAAFSILLPIAYLLILSPAFIALDSLGHFLAIIAALALAIAGALMSRGESGSVNLALLSNGFIGIAAGRIPAAFLDKVGRFWLVFCALYGALLITANAGWHTPLDQLLIACVALMAIFSVCMAIGCRTFFSRRLISLGRYSLLAYIVQIGALQALTRLVGRREPFTLLFTFQMFGVLLLTVMMADGLDWSRKRATWVDVPYRAVFA